MVDQSVENSGGNGGISEEIPSFLRLLSAVVGFHYSRLGDIWVRGWDCGDKWSDSWRRLAYFVAKNGRFFEAQIGLL